MAKNTAASVKACFSVGKNSFKYHENVICTRTQKIESAKSFAKL